MNWLSYELPWGLAPLAQSLLHAGRVFLETTIHDVKTLRESGESNITIFPRPCHTKLCCSFTTHNQRLESGSNQKPFSIGSDCPVTGMQSQHLTCPISTLLPHCLFSSRNFFPGRLIAGKKRINLRLARKRRASEATKDAQSPSRTLQA
eukprot:755319-Hanusia_phi.AAC.3